MTECIFILPATSQPDKIQSWLAMTPGARPRVAADTDECLRSLRERPAALIAAPASAANEMRKMQELEKVALLAWSDSADSEWADLTHCRADEVIARTAGPIEFSARAQRAIARRAPRPAEDRRRTDRSTGSETRAAFLAEAPEREAQARRTGQSLAILVANVCGLEQINLSYGRFVGDLLLRQFAERLAGCAQTQGWTVRLAGESFAMMQFVSDREAFRDIARRVERALAQPYDVVGERLSLAVQTGLACEPADRATVDALLRAAQADAQTAGRAEAEPTQSSLERVDDFASAIENGDLVLYYQPQVRIVGGGLAGAEALLRWRRASQGLVRPSAFLSNIEDPALLERLARWTIGQAAFDLTAWRRQGLAPQRITINAHAQEITLGTLEAAVRAASEAGTITASLFDVDVPLGALDRGGQVLQKLAALKALGTTLTLDAGHDLEGAVSALDRFDFAAVKIDRAGLRAAGAAGFAQALRGRGVRLAVSGVETAQDLASARELRCDEAQGHYFGPPAPPSSFLRATA